MFLAKNREVHNWHMTKDPPATPMNNRRTVNPVAELTSPVMAHGTAARHRMDDMRTRLPYLSQRGPSTNRMTMVPPTPTMLAVHKSWVDKLSDLRISDCSGVMANHTKNALKKENHAQWKALRTSK